MDLKDIKEVLTFAAFRPEADNPKFAWPQRFPKRKSVLVNVSRGQCSWAFVNRKGQIEETGEASGEFVEVATDMGDNWRANTEDGWIGLSVNNRFIISLEHNLSRKKGWEDEIRQNPKAILGTKHDRTKKYALNHNPETSASLLMACDESMIKGMEDSMRSQNLKPARICTGLFAMTSALLNRISSDNALRSQDLIVVTWCNGSLCILRQKGGQWQELRCRSGLPPEDDAAISQMIKPFVDASDPSTQVMFMADEANSHFANNYLSLFGNLHLTDMTETNNLWNIMARY